MRSRAIAWLCADCGLAPVLLEGGYKAFRRTALQSFDQRRAIVLLAGPTGAGKTMILDHLKAAGEQRIDLEGLANHRGSVFGSIPGSPQPTVEQFENNLFMQWKDLDPQRAVWIEGESRTIGRIVIPQGVWDQMSRAPIVYVDADRESRIEFLMTQYGGLPEDELVTRTQKIKKRLGGLRTSQALEAIGRGDWRSLCDILLQYYDRSYAKALDSREPADMELVKLSSPGAAEAIPQLLAAEHRLNGGDGSIAPTTSLSAETS